MGNMGDHLYCRRGHRRRSVRVELYSAGGQKLFRQRPSGENLHRSADYCRDYIGQTQTAANSSITSGNLTVGPATQAYHATAAIDIVIDQSPTAGTGVAPLTEVVFNRFIRSWCSTVGTYIGLTRGNSQWQHCHR